MKSAQEIMQFCLPDTRTAEAALVVARVVRDAGGQAFLVGGCVRDAILGHPAKDLDIEVYGLSVEQITALLASRFRLNTVGVSFGVIKLSDFDLDVALPRRESKASPGHRGFLINTVPDLSFREACERRDFTINAILANPLSGEIIDPCNGQRDLDAGVLRHIGEHFSEDPLRVLRAMQFTARFGFPVAPETLDVCRAMTPENLPRERLAGEWEKLLLLGTQPSLGLAFLRDCGWIQYYPELEALIGCEQNPAWHPEGDVWTHTLHAVDALPRVRSGKRNDDLLVALSVLCHDFGKPKTSVIEPDGRITSRRHEIEGAVEVRSFLARLWNSPDLVESVVRLVTAHMRPTMLIQAESSDKAFRKLAVNVGRMDLLANVVECDMRATPPNPPHLEIIDAFRKKSVELSVEHEPPKPLLLGRHLIERGLRPGPEFKTILDECYAHQIDGDFLDLESGLRFLDRRLKKKR